MYPKFSTFYRTANEDIESLDVLEKRVTELEKKIIGQADIDEINPNKVKPILNALHEVDTVLISSISGREKINTLLKTVEILNNILDPSYLDTINNADAKVEAILESEKDIHDYVNNLSRLGEVHSTLNNETIEQLPNLSNRINSLVSNLLKNKEQCDKQTAEVIQLTNNYKDCIIQISSLLVELEALITYLEIESQPKTVQE